VILAAERTELLLRIENFTTLRQAFKEPSMPSIKTFKASLLSLRAMLPATRSPEDPSTAVSTCCSPQRQTRAAAHFYVLGKNLSPPSALSCPATLPPLPFYAFDEVDMFLEQM